VSEERDRLLAAVDHRVLFYEVTGDSAPILDPAALSESAALLVAVEYDQDDIEVLTAVGNLHWHRYGLLHDDQDNTVAAGLLRPVHAADPRAVPQELARTFPPPRVPRGLGDPAALADQCAARLEDYGRTGDQASLDKAVRLGRDAVAATPEHHRHRGAYIVFLLAALEQKYSHAGDERALAEAVRLGRWAADVIPDTDDAKPGILCVLGEILEIWAGHLREPAVLDAAIVLNRQAAEIADPHTLSMVLSALGGALAQKAELTGDLAELREAVDTSRRANDLRPSPTHLTNLGHKLHLWYQRTGDLAALDEACAVDRQALENTSPGDVDRDIRLVNLATSLRDRSKRSGELAELTESVGLFRAALEVTQDGPRLGGRLVALAQALRLRFDHTAELADLREALGLRERALERAPDGHPDRSDRLIGLAHALIETAEAAGTPADPDKVIALAEESVATARAGVRGHPVRPVRLSDLGDAYRFRYQRGGDPADLERAVDLGEQALEQLGTDHPHRDVGLFNLASALRARYDRTGELAALDRAIQAFGQAAAAISDDRRPVTLALLGSALRARFDRTGDKADLDSALGPGRQAVRLAPGNPVILNNLCNTLQAWAEVTGDYSVLREAAELGRQAVDALPQGHRDQGMYLGNLSNTLRAWAEGDGGAAVLDQAVRVGRLATETISADHPLHGVVHYNLAAALRVQADRTGDPGTRREAIDAYRVAALSELTPPLIGTEAAAAWGTLAEKNQDWAEAYTGMSRAVELLPAVAPRGLDRSDQEHGLGDRYGLATHAAACALQLDRPERAVELLEQGRGILIAQALEAGPRDLADLHARHPEMATRFDDLRGRLADETPNARRRELVSAWNHLLAEVRALPGMAEFARPPSADRLVAQAGEGPIVMLNVSAFRGDALVVTGVDIRDIPLPGLTTRWCAERAATFLGALARITPMASVAERHQAGQTMLAVLADLWDTVASPVLASLGLTETPSGTWPRIWWAPTGPLTLLPIHAAGHHAEGAYTVLDRVVSSYIPTVRALEHARSCDERPDAPGDLLIAAVAQAPKSTALPGVAAETARLIQRFPTASVLRDGDATRDRVLTEIPAHRIAHFACHATTRTEQPSHSHLVLHDGPLSVLDISRRDLAGLRLAYLSACATTRTDPALADEAVHITTAFQLAGYSHVIGTLWPIADDLAPELTDTFYRELGQDTSRAAYALHSAVREIRHRYPTTPALWASHIHTGP
jgi:tetratricopeptide (TPR) repeat protein